MVRRSGWGADVGALVYGRGAAQIELSGGVRDMVDRMLRGSHGAVVGAMEREAREIFESAYRHWPVKTGKSRAALTHGLRIRDPSTLEAFVGNAVPYVFAITQPWPDRNKRVWRELISKPGKKRATKLAETMGDELRALAGR